MQNHTHFDNLFCYTVCFVIRLTTAKYILHVRRVRGFFEQLFVAGKADLRWHVTLKHGATLEIRTRPENSKSCRRRRRRRHHRRRQPHHLHCCFFKCRYIRCFVLFSFSCICITFVFAFVLLCWLHNCHLCCTACTLINTYWIELNYYCYRRHYKYTFQRNCIQNILFTDTTENLNPGRNTQKTDTEVTIIYDEKYDA